MKADDREENEEKHEVEEALSKTYIGSRKRDVRKRSGEDHFTGS